jgi:RNA polymerase sigma factor (sigma-70 family)
MMNRDLPTPIQLADELWIDVQEALGVPPTSARPLKRPQTEEALNELCADLVKIFRRNQSEFVFKVLCDLCHPYLERVGKRLARSRPYLASEELVLETFSSVFKNVDQFEPQGENAFFRWLNIIIKNHARMAERAKNRRLLGEQGGAAREADYSTDPAATAIAREELDLIGKRRETISKEVRACIAHLPPDRRECVRLKLDKKFSYERIAREMKISLGATAMRLKRAKEFVLKELAEKGIDVTGFEEQILELGAESTREAGL